MTWGWRPRSPLAAVLSVLGAVVFACAAVVSGLSSSADNHLGVVVPLIFMVAAVLAALACTRFAAFVYLLLGARASLDLFKLSGSSAGNTATNSATARGLDPSSIYGVLFLLAAGLWLTAQYAEHGHLKGSRLRLALVAFSAAGIIGLPGSAEPAVSALEILRILAVVMMYVVLEQLITDRKSLQRVLTAAYASMLFPLAYTTVLCLVGNPPSEVKGSFGRLTGPFSQAPTFARYLAFMVVFGAAIYPYLQRRVKLAMIGILSLSGVFLLLTLTRGALIGAVVGLVVVAIVQRSKTMLIGFVVAAVLAAIFVPGLAGRFGAIGDQRAVGGAPTGDTLEWRLNYWTQVLPLANENPVTGIGLNLTQYNTDDAKQPHNDFIRAYVETGLLGLGMYVFVLATMIRTGRLATRRAPPHSLERGVAVGFLGCATAFVLESLAANVMSNVVSLWYLIAFAAAASYVAERYKGAEAVAAPAPPPVSSSPRHKSQGARPWR